MENQDKDLNETPEQGAEPLPQTALEDGDVYFFNPWDRRLDEDFKPRMNSFEF